MTIQKCLEGRRRLRHIDTAWLLNVPYTCSSGIDMDLAGAFLTVRDHHCSLCACARVCVSVCACACVYVASVPTIFVAIKLCPPVYPF